MSSNEPTEEDTFKALSRSHFKTIVPLLKSVWGPGSGGEREKILREHGWTKAEYEKELDRRVSKALSEIDENEQG